MTDRSCSSTIRSIRASPSGLNITISSMRFKNSGRKSSPERAHRQLSRLLRVFFCELKDRRRANVRCHDDHRIAEIDRAAFSIGQTAVLQNL